MRRKGLLEFEGNRTLYGLFLFCAVCAIAGSLMSYNGEASAWRWLHYLTKPTATLLLLAAVLLRRAPQIENLWFCGRLWPGFCRTRRFLPDAAR